MRWQTYRGPKHYCSRNAGGAWGHRSRNEEHDKRGMRRNGRQSEGGAHRGAIEWAKGVHGEVATVNVKTKEYQYPAI